MQANGELDAGNSGTTLRLMSGILAGQPFDSRMTGDDSLRKRPMSRVMEPLTQMGAILEPSSSGITIHGKKPLKAIDYILPLPSAQVKSAVLLAGLLAEGTTTVIEPIPSRDHTERMLGLVPEIRIDGRSHRVKGGMAIPGREYFVPGDVSSAIFFICAALLVPKSEILLRNVGLNPTRTKALDLLRSVGARIHVDELNEMSGEPYGTISVSTSELRGAVTIDAAVIPLVIDEIPALAATLAVAGCSFEVRGARELRHKESDRISSVVRNLQAVGVECEEYPDGFAFQSKKAVISAAIQTSGDHRIAMAFGVAGMALKGGMNIPDAEVASVSFPGFWECINRFQ
jgi:3-phosphoshikimate 1-carboxyvinyltransferase